MSKQKPIQYFLITSANHYQDYFPFFSNLEPGYYEEGNFGIRIEDVIQVVTAPNTENYFNGKGALMFDCITMAPIQFKLMNVDLLSPHEVR